MATAPLPCATLIPPGHAVFVHVTTRRIRRAWLFGKDRFSNLRSPTRRFYAETRRVANGKVKRLLGWAPRHPHGRDGLVECLAG
jgi:hypothetical protein